MDESKRFPEEYTNKDIFPALDNIDELVPRIESTNAKKWDAIEENYQEPDSQEKVDKVNKAMRDEDLLHEGITKASDERQNILKSINQEPKKG